MSFSPDNPHFILGHMFFLNLRTFTVVSIRAQRSIIVNGSYIKGLDKQKFQQKTVNFFLPILFRICFGCSKNETVLLSTHKIFLVEK